MASTSKEQVFCEVRQVFLTIPAELSATGFELKIAGVVKVVKKGETSTLTWDPEELSSQDVAALYSSEADGWTVVDKVKIETGPGSHGASDDHYPVVDLEPAQSIVYADNPVQPDQRALQKNPFSIPVSDLKCIRESVLRNGVHTLTLYVKSGVELPPLHFHDGGTGGLLQVLQRFLYLVRDGRNKELIRVEENPILQKAKITPSKPSALYATSDMLKAAGLLHSAVLEAGKRVRHGFRATQNLLEERPEEGEADEVSPITCYQLEEKETGHSDPEASLISDFQVITDLRDQLPPQPAIRSRLPPLCREEWESYRDLSGRISPENAKRFKARVFSGSIDPDLRREAWKYLLEYFPYSSTDIERMEIQKEKEAQYDAVKEQWQSFLPEQERNWHKWRELKQLVEKDVTRTDREVYHSISSPQLKQLQNILCTYVMYNFDLGYVQGMSDLLSPLLTVMGNEADTFWCFVGLMNIVQEHFEMSQECMRLRIKRLRLLLCICEPKLYGFLRERESSNLYFTFRWLLVDFKREFEFLDLMILWEVLWTRHCSPDYALFVALAVIISQKEHLQKPEFDFSDIIAYINGLSKSLEVTSLLETAESFYRQLADLKQLPDELRSLFNEPPPVK